MLRLVALSTVGLTLGLTVVVALVAAAIVGWLMQGLGLEVATRAQAMHVTALMCAILAPAVLGPLVALVARHKALGRRLRAAALTDPLTGVPNRRAFFEAARHWLPGPEGARAFALLMIDVDHFKAVNDRLGHEAGDAALVHVAAALGGELAGGRHGPALLARLGGEEFAVFLDECGPTGAARAAAAMVAAMRAAPFRHGGAAVALTVSVGVWAGRCDGIDRALAAADDAVYRAKAAGRDRWEDASPPGPHAAPARVRRRTAS